MAACRACNERRLLKSTISTTKSILGRVGSGGSGSSLVMRLVVQICESCVRGCISTTNVRAAYISKPKIDDDRSSVARVRLPVPGCPTICHDTRGALLGVIDCSSARSQSTFNAMRTSTVAWLRLAGTTPWKGESTGGAAVALLSAGGGDARWLI